MPFYDFECSKCKKRFELYTFVKDRNNQKCPFCKEELKIIFLSTPEVCMGIGSDTRLSDIAPNEQASAEVKRKFKEMKRIKPSNPLKVRTTNN